jgi:hypothetical protein
MSGGLLTNMLLRKTGTQVDPGFSDRVRRHHAAAYNRYSADIRPRPGACELPAYIIDRRSDPVGDRNQRPDGDDPASA